MEDQNKILVSIIIPCYNHGQFIQEALDSVQQNNSDDFYEIIIVNDGSSDEGTILKLNDLREKGYRVIDQDNKGLSAARNTGIEKANGKYILPLDSDNKIDPQYYRKALSIFESNQGIGVVYSDKQLFGENERSVEVGPFDLQKLLPGNYIDACAVFRKECWIQINGYDEKIPGGYYEDWEFWLSIAKNNWRFEYLNETLFSYRVSPVSLNTRALDPKSREETIRYIIEKHADLYNQNYIKVVSALHGIIAHWEQNFNSEVLHIKSLLQNKENEIREFYHNERQDLVKGFEAHIQNLQAEFKIANNNLQNENQSLSLNIQQQLKILAEFELQVVELKSLRLHLEKKLSSSEEENHHYRELNRMFSSMVQSLEARIESMESTKTWRIRNAYHKARRILRISGGGKKVAVGNFFKKIVFFVSRNGRKLVRKVLKLTFKKLYLWLEDLPVRIIYGNSDVLNPAFESSPYDIWRLKNVPGEKELLGFKKKIEQFKYKPLVSILLPVYNPPIEYFRNCLDSVLGQVYENIEVCIADDCSSDPKVKEVISEYLKKDYRFKVVYRNTNGHISASSNTAFDMSNGEFCLLLDHDDMLTQDCVFRVVEALNENKDHDLIYSDEDKVDEMGRFTDPYFKPQWAPESFLTRNYIGHIVCIRRSLMEKAGKFRLGYEGSQDYDLLLRVTELTNKIYHLPFVLYHWRMHAASTSSVEEAKPYAYIAGKKAIKEALVRRNEKGEVSMLAGYKGYSVRYEIKSEDKVSIIIPTKDNTEILKQCLDSIYQKSTYRNFEIIVVSNNSKDASLFKLLRDYESANKNFIWFEYNIPFNFSSLMNEANKKVTGEYLILLNNDTEVITPDWIEGMLEQCQRKEIGTVGVKLLYPNEHIQHAGVTIGLGGVAGHIFTGMHKDSPGYFYYIHSVTNYSAVTAACLMCRKDVFDEVNGFTEEFSVEYNDTDFCLKVLSAGYRNVYLPHVELYHHESLTRGHPFTTKEGYDRHIREVNLFTTKWAVFIEDDPYYSPHLSRTAADARIMI
jgi:glycosyltransferase involved in cell wall biosynthesis